MIRRLIRAAETDPRIVGMLDYGSGAFGRADAWSDVDVAVYIRNEDFDAFYADWKAWAAGFGTLLLAYVGWVGHPWTVYDAEPVPLRVDFDLFPASRIERIATWPVNPVSVEAMVWYDGTDGALRRTVARLLGRMDYPADLHDEFDRLCGDFWYYLLYVHAKLARGQEWVARDVYHRDVLSHLARLLRIEAGSLDRWHDAVAVHAIEETLTSDQLRRLRAALPGPAPDSLGPAMAEAAELGREVCSVIAARNSWAWPSVLADRTVRLLVGR